MGVKNFIQNLRQVILDLRTPSVQLKLNDYRKQLEQVNELASVYGAMPDESLKREFAALGLQIKNEDKDVRIPAFALVREVCKRVLGQYPYDVQVLAGLVLLDGRLAEMQTGEGKTLAAVLPSAYVAMQGKGMHVLTFNDYLAQRDAEWMGPVYRFLGLSVACVYESMGEEERKTAYRCDITYAPIKVVGFDYLRSTLAWDEEQLILPPFHFAIVDEADALMIDEARNPLVLAAEEEKTAIDLYAVSNLVSGLDPGDYETDDYGRDVFLSEEGIRKIERRMGIGNLFAEEHHEFLAAVNLALQARVLLKRDVDYIINGRKVKLVDEFTGRIMKDRKWQHGLQMAVEAKEDLPLEPEGKILASLPLQHFLNLYPRISGMTATAQEAADEFMDFYGIRTVVIPPNKPLRRKDLPDLVFSTKQAKLEAIYKEVSGAQAQGRPVLIGTLSVKESEELAAFLYDRGLRARVLNAHNPAEEAAIIAEAGAPGAITISTNMAGRGTDIILGGSDGRKQDLVRSLGGLYVIGTNRHESLRIDKQLRGRAGRQGDPGTSRFIISFDDELMVRYKLRSILPPEIRNCRKEEALTEAEVLERIAQAQRIIEGQMFEMRRTLNGYSALLEKQRCFLQLRRSEIFSLEDVLLRNCLLNKLDLLWAGHLDHAIELREGIHLLRLGGEDPLRNFQKRLDQHFRELINSLDEEEQSLKMLADSGEQLPLAEKPSSTWTYLVNDNPFKNSLAINMLAGAFFGTSR